MGDDADDLAGDGDGFARTHRADAFNLIYHHAATHRLHHNANGARWPTARRRLAGAGLQPNQFQRLGQPPFFCLEVPSRASAGDQGQKA